MTALRERLLVALPTSETGHDGGCVSPFSRCEVDWGSKADRLIAALGADAACLEAAMAPDAVTVKVEEVARRLHESGDLYAHKDTRSMSLFPWEQLGVAERAGYVRDARRLLGIDGGK